VSFLPATNPHHSTDDRSVSVPWRGLVSFLQGPTPEELQALAALVSVPWRGLVSFLQGPTPEELQALAALVSVPWRGLVSFLQVSALSNRVAAQVSVPWRGLVSFLHYPRYQALLNECAFGFQSPGGDWCHFYSSASISPRNGSGKSFSPLAGIGVISTVVRIRTQGNWGVYATSRFSPLAGIGVISTVTLVSTVVLPRFPFQSPGGDWCHFYWLPITFG
jgi:hypothetical protein